MKLHQQQPLIMGKKANSGSRLAFGESVVEFGETNRENLRWPAYIREFVEISIICPNFHVYNWKSWQTNNEFTAVPPIPRPQNCSVYDCALRICAHFLCVHTFCVLSHARFCQDSFRFCLLFRAKFHHLRAADRHQKG